MKVIKKNKNLIVLVLLCIIISISIIIYKKESFTDYTDEVLLQEPLNDVTTINISTSAGTPILNNIYLTWETSDTEKMPPKMKETIELLKKVNNDCNIYIFDKDDRVNFIKKYFIKEVMDAYNSLIPGPYKADLWRYCILYKYGGIYQDIKMQPINGFKYSQLLLNDKEYYIRDHDMSGRGIYNAVLICKPRNQILLKCINKIIDNIKNKYYGMSSLYPTGPMLMKNFFSKTEIDNLEMYLNVKYDSEKNDIPTVILDNIPILKMYDEYRQDQQNLKLKSHSHMWEDHEIYQ
jgi:mannosyltransferase OCH1-like enzyme